MNYIIRKATVSDRGAIEQLIVESARGLSGDDYSEQQIEGAIKTVFGVDTNLILDGTYFVADNDGELIGCGGWRERRTLVWGEHYETRDATPPQTKTTNPQASPCFISSEDSAEGVAPAGP